MNNLKEKVLIILLLISVSFAVNAQTFQSIKALAQRQAPWLAPSINFVELAGNEDAFELSTKNGKLEIKATNANAASQALGWYLKYYCNQSISHFGDNIKPLAKLPAITKPIKISSPFAYRYALNYCTVSYSMSYYQWKDWEKELDWMALNGVNLMLAPVGVEIVWQNTLRKLGYSDSEISNFIAAPTFSAWWLMGNLEGWGGPVSQDMIEKQAALQKQIVARARSLGIEPVMQGFYGMVPTSLKQKLNVNVVQQGEWVGGFQRPDFLNPTDTTFTKIANIYYAEMKKNYGSDLKFFGGDPFHEGGTSAGIEVKAAAQKIQAVMQGSFPNSTWVLQGWAGNPSTKLLDGVDKKHTLIIELFGENTNNYEKTKAYQGTPFIWSNVSNFGEKNGIYGRLERFAEEVDKAKHSEYGPYLSGVGIIPEGIYNNPVAYDLMLELGWHNSKLNVKDWLKGYQQYRYGKIDANISAAWQQFLTTAYNSPTVYQEGPSESVLCARPALNIKTVSSWGTTVRNYDTSKFKEAVKVFVKSQAKFQHSETYQIDRIDFVRQVLANSALGVYQQMCAAINNNDIKAFRQSSESFIKLIKQQDALLANNKFFTVNRWLKQAVDMAGNNVLEKEITLKNAKMQITYWGSNDPKTSLRDYANKEWNGLLGTLYLERWKKFIDYQSAKLAGKEVKVPDYFTMEKEWTESKDMYTPKVLSESKLNQLIADILK